MGEIVKKLREDHPEWKVQILPPDQSEPALEKYKLKFGPAILVDGRVEFVGIPRYRMLIERVAMVASNRPNPRSAVPPAVAKPAPPPAAKPTAPMESDPQDPAQRGPDDVQETSEPA